MNSDTRPIWLYWRWWFCPYRSAAGGWYVVILGRGYHIKRYQ